MGRAWDSGSTEPSHRAGWGRRRRASCSGGPSAERQDPCSPAPSLQPCRGPGVLARIQGRVQKSICPASQPAGSTLRPRISPPLCAVVNTNRPTGQSCSFPELGGAARGLHSLPARPFWRCRDFCVGHSRLCSLVAPAWKQPQSSSAGERMSQL